MSWGGNKDIGAPHKSDFNRNFPATIRLAAPSFHPVGATMTRKLSPLTFAIALALAAPAAMAQETSPPSEAQTLDP